MISMGGQLSRGQSQDLPAINMENEAYKMEENIQKLWNSYSLDEFVRDISGIDPNVLQCCEWGSCQYNAAYAMYLTLEKMNQLGFSASDIFDEFTIPLRFSMRSLNGAIREDMIDSNRKMPEHLTVDEALIWMRDNAYDLWDAIEIIAGIWFGDELDYVCRYKKFKPPTFGPICNQIVQEKNYYVGLICHLLVKYGHASEDSFKYFDT